MLTKGELEAYKKFENPYLIEKDYLQEVILHEIYSNRRSTKSFVFKGGTALSKFYYSDRFSEDLDFNLIKVDESQDQTEEMLDEMARRLFYDTKFIKRPSINRFKTVSAELGIKGPRYNGRQSSMQHIRLEINTVSKMLYDPVQLPRNQTYGDIDEYIGTLMDKREILSEKFRAIMSNGRRHKERDLYDINFLIGKGTIPNHSDMSRKLNEVDIQFSKTALLAAINGIESSWKDLEPFVSHQLQDYAHVKRNTTTALKAAGIL